MFLLAKAPMMFKLQKRGGNWASLLFLLSPIFLCHKIKDGGYNNMNNSKLSPAQN